MRSPLWAVLVFSWVSSLGTGIATNGIFFMSKLGYGFSQMENYALGLAGGATYVLGALAAGPLLRLLRQRMGISTRGALAGLLLLLGLLCLVPITFAPAPGSRPAHWPIWLLMTAYQPLTGVLWPVVESYLSGGRKGEELRSALGRFNITWCSALVVALLAMGPLVERHAPQVIASLTLVHWLSLLLLKPMGREPGIHLEGEHEPHPPVYHRLLATFRVLLPTSYMVLTALQPYLPTALAKLGVRSDWQTPIASTWTAGRVLTFILLERWHGWHGRWYPAIVGILLLLGGFAAAVISPLVTPAAAGLSLMIAGLACFGVGMATIYTAALYYAMEVGVAQVDAGGKHEALIGVGYTVGPACGLAAGFAASTQLVSGQATNLVMLGLVATLATGVVCVTAIRVSRRHL
jgi:hypothetical protein